MSTAPGIEETALEGVVIVRPPRFADSRGYFSETWNRAAFAATGIDVDFVQDNHSASVLKGTVRGLHAQAPPFAQAKLVRCVRGEILDVAVDIRRGSPSFGKSVTVRLSAENGAQLFIPPGFLHGFVTLSDGCEVLYKCSAPYARDAEIAARFDTAGIDWGIDPAEAILSAKDDAAPPLSALRSPF
ncbi:MAG: dTDP-4-dehydrorhamnose 3,5-epimerase [Rubricella sp.]